MGSDVRVTLRAVILELVSMSCSRALQQGRRLPVLAFGDCVDDLKSVLRANMCLIIKTNKKTLLYISGLHQEDCVSPTELSVD